jgi:WD40 repeat protein
MSTPQNPEEVLLALALQKPADKRQAFLDAVCDADPVLRQRIEALLAVSNSPDPSAPVAARPVKATILIEMLDAEDEAVGKTIGRYKILEKVGEGGCGVVYVAEQTEPVRRRVALKVIKLGMDTKEVIGRFEAERQALAMMDHPNIAKVFDAGATETGRPFFVMELVRGIRITDYCDQNNLTTKERLDLFIQVCQAIQHAHQKGIIHRDIKPSNILVTLHDGMPAPKVIDFGIAKATAGQTLTDKTVYTQLQQFIGTPAYMSPEQAEMSGLDIDTRSDIYSLGVLLYELLAGSTPFDANELMSQGIDAMRKVIRQKEPMRPSTRVATLKGDQLTTTAKRRSADTSKLLHQLKGDLDWIVMKCLEKDRTRRYETANGLASDLKRHLSNEPVVARPPSAAYKFQKAIRRNKLAFAAAAAVAAALVIGITVSSWQAIEAKRARTAEEEQRMAAQTERDNAKTAQAEAERAQQAEKQARLQADADKKEAERRLYFADMNLVQEAWEQNNIDRMRQLLTETQESPYRGFEWYYWPAQTHLALKTIRSHFGAVYTVAISPDGNRMATGGWDHTARVLEAATGRQLLTLRMGGAVYSVAFSPDGQRVVTAEQAMSWVWDLATGRKLVGLAGHGDTVMSASFSSDGQRIVTCSYDKTAKVWEAASGRELVTLKGHAGPIWCAAFSPDGQRIVTGSEDGSAKVWETASGKDLLTLRGDGNLILSVAFSPDGQRIVTGSSDHTASVWNAASGTELFTLTGHRGGVMCVSYSPDGHQIVTGSDDNTAKVWEAASGRELFTLKGHSGAVRSVAFSPDGMWILTGSRDGTAKVWETASGLSADETSLSRVPLKGHTDQVYFAAFSPDGQRIVTGSTDNTVKVWESATGKELLTLKAPSNDILSMALSPDGRRIVIGNADKTAKVWDAASGRELITLKGIAPVTCVAFSPDGRRIVTDSQDGRAKVWEVASGKEVLTLRGHGNSIWSLAFSPDGQRIVIGSTDHTASVWDAATGMELFTLAGHGGGVTSVSYSPNGHLIVTSSDDNTAKVWDAGSGKELVTLKGHSSAVSSVAFSPDGQRIVTASYDNTVRLWETTSGLEVLTLKGHTAPVMSVAFSPNGQRIVSAGRDKTARVWEASSSEQCAAWLEEERAARQHLADMQHDAVAEEDRQKALRAQDSIKRWLVLAPIPLADGQSGTDGLDIQQIASEAQFRPRAGESISIGGRELKWKQVILTSAMVDFNAMLGQVTEHSVAYAVCYIRSDVEQRGLHMLVGSDDQSKVFLNGTEIYKYTFSRPAALVEDIVPGITLNAGLNTLVFKVVNELAMWKGSIRFTDAQGNSVKGIKMTLNPETKD